MKITNAIYHNIDWFVKSKVGLVGNRRKVVSKSEKQVAEPNLDVQKIKQEFAKKLEEKFKEIAKKNYIVNITIHEKTRQYVIKIIDPKTKQVVTEMPWEKFLDMVAYMIESLQKHSSHNQHEKSNIKKVK
ncbi:MAG: flagellar protein FlaG [Candidatus Desulfofervidaceae bacterium]|nr:flagellar protein FlaG [Candidatus Desulfofervidaceae bacterium]MDL1970019.1 flagellar protein FlaG [Candidatus Desulfofervidaceae bacterium]